MTNKNRLSLRGPNGAAAIRTPCRHKEDTAMNYYVYILSSATDVTIYTGVTKDLVRRVYEHKHNLDPDSFTARYGVHKLVYYEETTDVRAAIEREKQIKSWSRKKKNRLVETMNPTWEYLYGNILP